MACSYAIRELTPLQRSAPKFVRKGGGEAAASTKIGPIVGPCEIWIYNDVAYRLDVKPSSQNCDAASSPDRLPAGWQPFEVDAGSWHFEWVAA